MRRCHASAIARASCSAANSDDGDDGDDGEAADDDVGFAGGVVASCSVMPAPNGGGAEKVCGDNAIASPIVPEGVPLR